MATYTGKSCSIIAFYSVTFIIISRVYINAELNIDNYNYNADTFETETKAKTHAVLMFTNPETCKDCQEARNVIHELMQIYNEDDSNGVTVSEFDCSEYAEICSKLDVKTYPELHFFNADKSSTVKYVGDFEKDDLISFIDAQSKKLSIEPKNGLYQLTQEQFRPFISEGRHFIKFYAPWCGHCKKLSPTWDLLAKAFESNENIIISKIDCTAQQDNCRDYNIRSYPTLKFFRSGEETDIYSGPRDLENLKRYVTEQLEKPESQEEAVTEPPQKEEQEVEEQVEEKEEQVVVKSAVRELNDDDFGDVTSSGIIFVKFYAPWCGHCKRLAPTWDELGTSVLEQNGVSVAKVDCTLYQTICTDNGVRGYPTLFLYKDGEKQSKYTGSRDLDSLKTYLKEGYKKDEL